MSIRTMTSSLPGAASAFTGLLLALVALVGSAQAATLPTGFSETQIASGLVNPTAFDIAPDGRIFVCEQGGALRVIENGVLLSTPFVTVTVNSVGERGLLGVAFDPNFATNQWVYVYYTATSPAVHNRISRFTASGNVAVPGSEVVILDLNNLSGATNHNGGAIHFGPDGKLYAAVGDNANGSNSQSMSNLLGKMLRLNSDGTVPTDNPFFNTATGNNRMIWALGLRNPFTFSFQNGTGLMYINDVGQNTWEEIDQGAAGANYGWPSSEGPTTTPGHTGPVFWYGHGSTSTTGCAITGGAFYNPDTVQFPAEYVGLYFFADYCTGWIRKYNPGNGQATDFASDIAAPVDLKVSSEGSLYYLARGVSSNQGHLRKINYTSALPSIAAHPQNRTVSVGQSATFTVEANGGAPLSYQWQRDSVDIPGATSSSYTLTNAQLGDNGAQFRARVSNPFGSVTSNAATLTVTTNQAPSATITSPAHLSTYAAGQTINYSGTATDPEDGTLGASRFSWTIVFHHDTHTHPFLGPINGVTSGSFVVPDTGETAANVFYRIQLTVTDSANIQTTTFVDILPQTASITLQTLPPGLTVTLDGQPMATPLTITSVVGMRRMIGVPTPQTSGATTYSTFGGWSDGGAQTHEIVTPTAGATYTAQLVADNAPTRAPAMGDFDSNNSDTVGLYFTQTGVFALRNSNTAGVANVQFVYGAGGQGWVQLVGDWDGDGDDTPGVYVPVTGVFHLRNSNTSGPADIAFQFGPQGAGWVPVAGDWDGNGTTTIGLYNPATGVWYLRNSNTDGPADLQFQYGPGGLGWQPIAGNWDNVGGDTVGLYEPSTSVFYLRNSNTDGPANMQFQYGASGAGWLPVAGNWDAVSGDTIGLYDRPNGIFYLRNSNTAGTADLQFQYGPTGTP